MTDETPRGANISVTIDIENLTWRDLIWFASLGERQGIDPDTPVMHRYHERLDTFEGFEVFVDPKTLGTGK